MKLEFSRLIFEKKNPQISNFMNIRPVGAELFHPDRQADDEANSRFSQFCERAKKRAKEFIYCASLVIQVDNAPQDWEYLCSVV